MSFTEYEQEALDEGRKALAEAVVGQKVMAVAPHTDRYGYQQLQLTLEGGRTVSIVGYGDCCAWADVSLVESLHLVDHVITSVTPSAGEDAETWFIYAAGVPVATLKAEVDEANGYYGFGFTVDVRDA